MIRVIVSSLVLVIGVGACGDQDSVNGHGTVEVFYPSGAAVDAIGAGQTDELNNIGGSCLYNDPSRLIVTDEHGDIIKTLELREGENTLVGCRFTIDTDLPARDFYTFKVSEEANADKETVSRTDLEHGDLSASLHED